MAMDTIEHASKSDAQVVVVSQLGDHHYNRFRYTLVSYIVDDSSTGEVIYSPIRKVLLAMIEAAFATINLESQSGTHPRIGVVDDLSFHPVGQATIEDAASLAKQVASDIGNGLQGMSKSKNQLFNYFDLPQRIVYLQSQCSCMQQPTQQESLWVQFGVSLATTVQITRKTSG